MFSLVWTDFFKRKATKFLQKHPDLKDNFKELVTLMEINPFEQSLKTHKLKGNLKEFYGISLTYSYRLVVDIKVTKNEIILLNIGSHDEVY